MQNRLLGIHMIVQNEEQHLPRCLDSLKQAGLEWFITDTGSSDRTADIARTYGATVLHASWEDDFAKARNISLPLATTEWILCLDADEYVIEGLEQLMSFLPNVHKSITRLRITIENQYGEGTEDKILSHPVRLFRAQHGYQYTGRIHEQLFRQNMDDQSSDITLNKPQKKMSIHSDSPEICATGNLADVDVDADTDTDVKVEPLAPLRLGHDGYLATVIAKGDKAKRNLHLIERELADHPADPFHLYNLGVTRCQLGDPGQAAEAFSESLKRAVWQAPYRPTLVRDLAKVLVELERYEEAHLLLSAETQRYPAYADLHLIYGEVLEQQGLQERAYRAYARASTCGSGPNDHGRSGGGEAVNKAFYVTEAGSCSYRAYASMARLAQKRGFGQEAVRLYELALEQLSAYRPAWIGLADALQQQGHSDDSIAGQLMHLANRLHQIRGTDHADQMNRPHPTLEKETEIVLIHMLYALANCGAYKQALLLLGGEASHIHVPVGDQLHWMLCAGQVTDAWDLAQSSWGEADREEHKQISFPSVITSGVEDDADMSLQSDERSDWALACWASGRRLTSSFLAKVSPLERGMWKVADRLLFEYKPGTLSAGSSRPPVPAASDRQLLQWSEPVQMMARQLVARAIQSGQLVIAQQLHERLACIMSDPERTETAIRRNYAGLLHRYGYTMIAAEMLIQCMTEGELDAEGLFCLGETLYSKGHLEQALSLLEQALEQKPDFSEARVGAAICYLQMALGLIHQERNRSSEVRVLANQQLALEQQLRTAEGIPWRTVYHAKERRNHHAGTSASETAESGRADLSVHDRQG
ncbi:glycosyltransferase [Paenibacillus sp. RRE4]|uniref:glycosyltransferase n=1 Tax=Paenibacillus sp. RRE4 TaxID=2962587 RepID=UPI0028820DE0|nr:glycosyltransferase [Paenibacillus sp. RRE4]MDT0124666.1 glycosyltransferase [Paenibacillus sp. RRE4]